MQIHLHTDHNLDGREALSNYVDNLIYESFGRFHTRITRVDVHLGDENAAKQGVNDKRCLIEVRIQGLQPTAVTTHANTVHDAIVDATDKMTHSLAHTIGKRDEQSF